MSRSKQQESLEVTCPGSEESKCKSSILFCEIKSLIDPPHYEIIYPKLLYKFLKDEKHFSEYKECQKIDCENIIRREDNVNICELCNETVMWDRQPDENRYRVIEIEDDLEISGLGDQEQDGPTPFDVASTDPDKRVLRLAERQPPVQGAVLT